MRYLGLLRSDQLIYDNDVMYKYLLLKVIISSWQIKIMYQFGLCSTSILLELLCKVPILFFCLSFLLLQVPISRSVSTRTAEEYQNKVSAAGLPFFLQKGPIDYNVQVFVGSTRIRKKAHKTKGRVSCRMIL